MCRKTIRALVWYYCWQRQGYGTFFHQFFFFFESFLLLIASSASFANSARNDIKIERIKKTTRNTVKVRIIANIPFWMPFQQWTAQFWIINNFNKNQIWLRKLADGSTGYSEWGWNTIFFSFHSKCFNLACMKWQRDKKKRNIFELCASGNFIRVKPFVKDQRVTRALNIAVNWVRLRISLIAAELPISSSSDRYGHFAYSLYTR